MHGRITRYSMATESGVIVNYSKKIFELRKENWQDRKFLPVSGMFVEFRLDDGGHIVDAHSSKFQDFGEDSLLKEIDFWKTNTDEELKAIESDRLNKQAEEIFEKTDYLNMKSISISKGAEECVREHFAAEANSVKFALDEVEEIPQEDQLNYLAIKRFLVKAMDFLVFCDKKITSDMFAIELQKIRGLEYSFKELAQSAMTKPENIYTDVFLDKQLHYKGATKAISNIKEQIMQLNNKAKYSNNEARKLRAQLEINKADPTLPAKIDTQTKIAAKAEEEAKTLYASQERLESLTKNFKASYMNDFVGSFQAVRVELVDKVRNALNLIATHLDNKMWKIGMESVSVHNGFFRHDVNSPYCTMTFYWQYLKRLDKSKISDAEKAGYNFYQRYMKSHEKLFLIYTTNFKVELALKIEIMTMSKENKVVIAKTDGEFISHINSSVIEQGYIDPTIRSNPNQLIEVARKSRHNSGTDFIVLTKQEIEQYSKKGN